MLTYHFISHFGFVFSLVLSQGAAPGRGGGRGGDNKRCLSDWCEGLLFIGVLVYLNEYVNKRVRHNDVERFGLCYA
jgi:hypothetical protein